MPRRLFLGSGYLEVREVEALGPIRAPPASPLALTYVCQRQREQLQFPPPLTRTISPTESGSKAVVSRTKRAEGDCNTNGARPLPKADQANPPPPAALTAEPGDSTPTSARRHSSTSPPPPPPPTTCHPDRTLHSRNQRRLPAADALCAALNLGNNVQGRQEREECHQGLLRCRGKSPQW